jgi:hypothetical protein
MLLSTRAWSKFRITVAGLLPLTSSAAQPWREKGPPDENEERSRKILIVSQNALPKRAPQAASCLEAAERSQLIDQRCLYNEIAEQWRRLVELIEGSPASNGSGTNRVETARR